MITNGNGCEVDARCALRHDCPSSTTAKHTVTRGPKPSTTTSTPWEASTRGRKLTRWGAPGELSGKTGNPPALDLGAVSDSDAAADWKKPQRRHTLERPSVARRSSTHRA
jgi:hypothetical protein